MRNLEKELSRSSRLFSVFWEVKNEANMPIDYDKDVYPETPRKTPIVNKQTMLPNPAIIMSKIFYYAVDLPVTMFRDTIDSIQSKNKLVYYHRVYRRVPDFTECEEGDFTCYYEADMQFHRDLIVDRTIVNVIQERLHQCVQREGDSALQNCAKERQQFEDVTKNYNLCYGELGANRNARKCLMKQKERMMAAQAKRA
ncbi:NADH dehydrogenase [ubiquinone] 1 beta subcomplex subunit 10 [Nematolebias whitei]|uniref:NADH dehydrogenase [ubiquinone] 1 beta subcomplex subunit 10 n=1 Tax=Nematolebias whitei TaxID=451745 RepID=UPI001899F0B0|nr:NADH dehydrogenase [ubiquinone] 1 beta subcomplex subunit 10 [Nematolebias whitei]